eukprot:TRINITY_DN537_c3_g1_i1.p1 TRINITY_DN537_c3_g1~~TRINITY_DN537_c3_g1_i1.p1  ORF type:complete len:1094 (+),score=245.51 TRINITY_DN537_c3_g1_i1:48-3284(+)
MPPNVKKEPGEGVEKDGSQVSGVSVHVPSSVSGGVGYAGSGVGTSIVGTDNLSEVSKLSKGSIPSVPSGGSVSSLLSIDPGRAGPAAFSDVSTVSAGATLSSAGSINSGLVTPLATPLENSLGPSGDISLTSPSVELSGRSFDHVKQEPRPPHQPLVETEMLSRVTGKNSAVTALSRNNFTTVTGNPTTDHGSTKGGSTVYESLTSKGSFQSGVKSEVSLGPPESAHSVVTGPPPSQDTDDIYSGGGDGDAGFDIHSVSMESFRTRSKDTTADSNVNFDQIVRPHTRQMRRMNVTPLVTSQEIEQLEEMDNTSAVVDLAAPDEYTQAVLDDLTSAELGKPRNDFNVDIVNAAEGLVLPDEEPVEKRRAKKQQVVHSVRLKKHENEKAEKDRIYKKYGHDKERAEVEEQRSQRKRQAKTLMGQIEQAISTNTTFALATPMAPRYPRLMKPVPSLEDVTEYKPTQLELEWNKKLLSHIDWVGVGDINMTSPSVYGKGRAPHHQPQIDARDKQLLISQIPYDRNSERDVWKGRGKVPIFTVRPAYTEIGLRGSKRKAKRQVMEESLVELRKTRDAREKDSERQARFAAGIKKSFSATDTIDNQWLIVLVRTGEVLGLGLNNNKEKDTILRALSDDPRFRASFKLLRQQTLKLASHCSPAALSSLKNTFLSVTPSSTLTSLPNELIYPELNSPHTPSDLEQWQEAWVLWGVLYVEEMKRFNVTEGQRNKRVATAKAIEEVLKTIAQTTIMDRNNKKVKNELLHPTDRRANLVSVKEIQTEDPVIREEREMLLAHFETSDPLPVDRLVPEGVDFFELENKEQLAKKHNADDVQYEGSMLYWKRDLTGKIDAEFLLPSKKVDDDKQRKVKELQHETLIEASWNAPSLPSGERLPEEYNVVNTYDGRLMHQRESAFVFRETATDVKISYPPKRLVLDFSADRIAENRNGLMHHKLTDVPIPGQGRKTTKYIFSWEEDLAKTAEDDDALGRRAAYEEKRSVLKRKYAEKYQKAAALKKRKILTGYGSATAKLLTPKEEPQEDETRAQPNPPPELSMHDTEDMEGVQDEEEVDKIGDALRKLEEEED